MSVALQTLKYGPRPRLRDMRGAVHVNPGRDVYINFGGYRRTFAQGVTGDTLVEFGPFAMAGVANSTCESTNGYLQISSGSDDNMYPFVNPNLVGGFGNVQYSEAIAYNNFATEFTNAWQGPAVFINASDGGSNVGNYYFADLLRVGGANITLRLTRRNSLTYTTLGTDYTEAKNYAQKPVHLAIEGHDYGAGTRVKVWLNGKLTHDVDDTAANRLGAAVSSGITGQQTSAPGYAYGNSGAQDTVKWVLRMRAGNGFFQPDPDTPIYLFGGQLPPPTVTDVNGDETFGAPSTGNVITGTNFL